MERESKIIYEIGNERLGEGRTRLKLSASGELEIENVRALHLKKKLPEYMEDEVEAIFRSALEKEIWDAQLIKEGKCALKDSHGEAGYRGEPRINFIIDEKAMDISEDEVDRNPLLNSLVNKIHKLIQDNANWEDRR